MWWQIPLTPELVRQRQVVLHEFEASLIYKESFRPAKCYIVSPSKKEKEKYSPLMMIFKEIDFIYVCLYVSGSVCTHACANVYLGGHGGQKQMSDHLGA